MIIVFPMPRTRSDKVENILYELKSRIQSGHMPPGSMFFSARQLAKQFEISYQTAHRLLDELANAKLISRKTGSGSYVAGKLKPLTEAWLIFSKRAQRAESFGQTLLHLILRGLRKMDLTAEVVLTDTLPNIPDKVYPVFWEQHLTSDAISSLRRYCLILNDYPHFGLASRWVDSLGVDDFGGGIAAAELLKGVYQCKRIGVLAGPPGDERSRQRQAGFLSAEPTGTIYQAGSWGPAISARALCAIKTDQLDGIFCVNDRLAAALKSHFQKGNHTSPKLVGFDNAPVAIEKQIPSIAIPWQMFADHAVEKIRSRLGGSTAPPTNETLSIQPIIR